MDSSVWKLERAVYWVWFVSSCAGVRDSDWQILVIKFTIGPDPFRVAIPYPALLAVPVHKPARPFTVESFSVRQP